MPAPLSVIVPTLDAGQDLAGCAAALGEGLQAGLIGELIVSDGGSTDGTIALADALGAEIVTGPASRGGQLKRGVAAARRDWLLLLHADTELAPGWTGAVRDHIARHPDDAGYFRLAFRADGAAPRIVAAWANLRSRALGLPYGDQGLLIGKGLLERAGGVPDIPLMEDVALARALRGRLRPLAATARTSPARYLRDGWAGRSLGNGLTLLRFLAGTPPDRLAARYRRGD